MQGEPGSGTSPSLRCEFAPPADGTAGFGWRGSYSRDSGPALGLSWSPGSSSEDAYIGSGDAWALVTASCLGSAGVQAHIDVLLTH